jgi:hypothetical protein
VNEVVWILFPYQDGLYCNSIIRASHPGIARSMLHKVLRAPAARNYSHPMLGRLIMRQGGVWVTLLLT